MSSDGHDRGARRDRLSLGVAGHDNRPAQRLTDLDRGLRARRAPQLDRAPNGLDRSLERLVDERAVGLGEVEQMNGVRLHAEFLRLAARQVRVDLVGQEWREGRQQRGDGQQAVAQGGERCAVALPEAAARQPHVPVGELLHVGGDRAPGRRAVVSVHALDHRPRRSLQARQRPAIEVTACVRAGLRAGAGVRRAEILRTQALGVRVQDPERVRVPEREHELAHRLAHRVGREAVAGPGLLGGEVVPAEGVRAVAVDHLPGIDHVAAALRHLLALRVEDQAEDDAVAVARAVEDEHRDREQRVEPAAGLVDRLADEVGREAVGEQLLSLERVVELGERHRARVVPGVDRLPDAAHLAAAGLAAQRDLVDVGAVEVVGHLPAALAQIGHRSGAEALLAALGPALPDRQRGAPVALARERPVDVALEPVAEPAVLDVLGVPADLLVLGQHPVADVGGAHVPARLGVVQKRRPAAPAVRIGVAVALGAEQAARVAKRLDDRRVGVLHELAREVGDPLVEGAVLTHRVLELDPVLLAEPEVVLAEGDRGVHEAGALLRGHEVRLEHGVAARPVVGDVGEGRLVADAGQGAARQAIEDLCALPQHSLDQRRGDHQDLVGIGGTHPRVLDLGADGNGRVGDQRPGRGGPDQEASPSSKWRRLGSADGKRGDVYRGVLDVLVALGDLVRGERRAAAGAVGDHLVALVKAPVVPDLAQRPPDRLDVGVGERHVGVVEVDPEADPLGEPVPFLDVAEHRLAAALVELGDPVGLDLGLRGDPELPLDLQLDGQAVAVPAGLARHPMAAHGAGSGDRCP